jgi:hypothetical protein
MRRIICHSTVLALALAFTGAGVASAATTLGTTTQPTGSTATSCTSEIAYGQSGSAPGTPYALSGPGLIKQWSMNVTGATSGADIYFLVLRPSGGQVTVVGVDQKTVPASLPTGGVARFTIASPILAQKGDFLGVYTTDSSSTCLWTGSGIPSGATASAVVAPGPAPLSGPPTKGQTLVEFSPSAGEVNVSALVEPAVSDVAVTAGSIPVRPTIGNLAALQAKVVNHGPTETTVTFTDTVPTGLAIEAATIGGGSCSVAGQLVTCTRPALASGGTSAVNVIVLPKKTGTYTNSVNVSAPAGVKDPNLANNSSTATVKVAAPGPTNCIVPVLTATPEGVAQDVLKLLGCRVTVQLKKVPAKRDPSVPKGAVLSTNPGRGTYAVNRLITLVVRK